MNFKMIFHETLNLAFKRTMGKVLCEAWFCLDLGGCGAGLCFILWLAPLSSHLNLCVGAHVYMCCIMCCIKSLWLASFSCNPRFIDEEMRLQTVE